MVELYPEQKSALARMRDGCILKGGVGSGKTFTSLHYYLDNHIDQDLYVITTAKKRDSKDWEYEAQECGIYHITIDSWNSIKKYKDVVGAFFIFDEHYATGNGAWAKTFVKICKRNKWIVLSATPGDNWMNYMMTFIAKGYYRNQSDFKNQHCIYDPYVKFPKITGYRNEAKLFKFRQETLVNMHVNRHTTRERHYIKVKYDKEQYNIVTKKRWNVFENKPIESPTEFVLCQRKIVNTSEQRIEQFKTLLYMFPKVIVFYNFDYERDIIRQACKAMETTYAEYNGHKHQDIPHEERRWCYAVNYGSGAEAWNCTITDTIIFFSLNYSYRIHEQCEGRIDRLNTPYKTLHYYYLNAPGSIDSAIIRAISSKKEFNERGYVKRAWKETTHREQNPSVIDTKYSAFTT